MKRLFSCVLAVLIVLIAFGCGKNENQKGSEGLETVEPSATLSLPLIALVLSSENSFNSEFCLKAQESAASLGYTTKNYYSNSGESQVNNIYSAIGEGAKSIIIEPYDMDNLQVVLEECDAQNIPVINALTPINGIVKMLIAPDFAQIGKLVAKSASAFGEDVNVLSVEDNASAFINQLTRDGLISGTSDYDNVSLAASVITENDVAKAQEEISKALLAEESINTIFAYTEEIAKAAVKAAQESGKTLNIITVGGGKDIIELIEQGAINSAVFLSPAKLAQQGVKSAVEAVNGMEIPQFSFLDLEIITSENVGTYKAFGSYADTVAVAQPSQTPLNTTPQ